MNTEAEVKLSKTSLSLTAEEIKKLISNLDESELRQVIMLTIIFVPIARVYRVTIGVPEYALDVLSSSIKDGLLSNWKTKFSPLLGKAR